MIKTRIHWVRWAGMGGLCLALAACGGEDPASDSPDNGSESEETDGDDADNEYFDANQQHSNQQNSTQESECSSSSECEFVVCDCADGAVNFQGCKVVNDVGTCATESTCASAFSACD